MSVGQPPLNSPHIRRLAPVLEPGHNYTTVTDKIAAIVLTRPVSLGWLAGFGLAFSLVMMLNVAVAWLIIKGVGIWGINIPIGWGFAIVNYVWWIAIASGGTFISALFYLVKVDWRTSLTDAAVRAAFRERYVMLERQGTTVLTVTATAPKKKN